MNNLPVGYVEKMRMLKSDLLLSKTEKVSVEDLSRMVMKSTSTLYKACSMTEDNPPPFDVDWLVPFMNAKHNYKILRQLCLMTGHLPPAKMPAFKKTPPEESKMAIEYQKISNEAVTKLMEFLVEPNETLYQELKVSLEQIIKESLTINSYCKNHIGAQEELF